MDRLAQYDKDGLRFQYPGNWKVIKDTCDSGPRIIILKGHGDEQFTVNLWNPPIRMSLAEYASGLWALKKSKVGGKSRNICTMIEIGGEPRLILRQEFDAYLLAKLIGFRTQYIDLSGNERTLFLVMEAPLSNWTNAENGFKAIYSTIDY